MNEPRVDPQAIAMALERAIDRSGQAIVAIETLERTIRELTADRDALRRENEELRKKCGELAAHVLELVNKYLAADGNR